MTDPYQSNLITLDLKLLELLQKLNFYYRADPDT